MHWRTQPLAVLRIFRRGQHLQRRVRRRASASALAARIFEVVSSYVCGGAHRGRFTPTIELKTLYFCEISELPNSSHEGLKKGRNACPPLLLVPPPAPKHHHRPAAPRGCRAASRLSSRRNTMHCLASAALSTRRTHSPHLYIKPSDLESCERRLRKAGSDGSLHGSVSRHPTASSRPRHAMGAARSVRPQAKRANLPKVGQVQGGGGSSAKQ